MMKKMYLTPLCEKMSMDATELLAGTGNGGGSGEQGSGTIGAKDFEVDETEEEQYESQPVWE